MNPVILFFLFFLTFDPVKNDDIRLLLYPFKRSPTHSQHLTLNPTSITNSNFIPNAKTVIIIHGFWPGLTAFGPRDIKNAYLTRNTSTPQNTLYLDWSTDSTPRKLQVIPSYFDIVFRRIPIVSQTLSDILFLLIKLKFVDPTSLHLIGYSLGAHVAGLTGKILKDKALTIGRITGLDPALPLFQGVFKTHRLNRHDAGFVDVIHTAMARGGWRVRVVKGDGDVDFYPNGGSSPQPGCLLMDLAIPVLCSHLYAIHLYIASITQELSACKCEPMVDLILGVVCLGGCRRTALLGEGCGEGTPPGQYHLKSL